MGELVVIMLILAIVSIVASAFVAPIVEAQERELYRAWHESDDYEYDDEDDDYYDEEL